VLAMESETILASMATFLSWRPGTLGNSDMESFFDEYMPCVVAHERSCGPPMLHRKRGRAIFEGARFVATNADGSFPSTKGPLPGTGAIVEAVRVTTDEKPVKVGKPFSSMYDMALKDLSTARERTVMIGDTLDSDIVGAKRVGISGVLVSQEYTQDNADGGDSMVDAVIQNLTGLFDSGITTLKKAGR
jgi:ribonucleotide monophosphatase NagD (HAD superfamily)